MGNALDDILAVLGLDNFLRRFALRECCGSGRRGGVGVAATGSVAGGAADFFGSSLFGASFAIVFLGR
jgi:hypothetical protein